jgi:hypothetical protein
MFGMPLRMPRIRQREAAGMTQHVGMHQKAEPSTLAYALDKAIYGVGRDRN